MKRFSPHTTSSSFVWVHQPYYVPGLFGSNTDLVPVSVLPPTPVDMATTLRTYYPQQMYQQSLADRTDCHVSQLVWLFVGQVSCGLNPWHVAALIEDVFRVPVFDATETVGRFTVHLNDDRIPLKVCPHGKWSKRRDTYELLIDTDEFAAMTAATLKSFISENLHLELDEHAKIVDKKTKGVCVLVPQADIQRLCAAFQHRVLEQAGGSFLIAQTPQEEALLKQYTNSFAIQGNGLADQRRHAVLPKSCMTLEKMKRPPRR